GCRHRRGERAVKNASQVKLWGYTVSYPDFMPNLINSRSPKRLSRFPARIKFVLQEPAVEFSAVQLDTTPGPQTDFLRKFQIPRKHVSGIALAFLFHEITDACIGLFERRDLAQSFAVLRIEVHDAGFSGHGRVVEIADTKINHLVDPCPG